MPERINKLQPDRTVALRGFNTFAAAATIHNASPTGFTVSGTFRDPADFAVAVLYDADNVFEHPLIKYLPDFNFAGMTLSFDLTYSEGLQPIDSPKYNWIDWATLDCILADGATAQVNLWDNATLSGTSFPAASATFNVVSPGAVQPSDRVTLWYENLAFDYTVPSDPSSVTFQFYAKGTGTVHSITVNGTTYSYMESNPAGESSAEQATALAAAMVNDPYVTASPAGNAVVLTAKTPGVPIAVSASDGNGAATMYLTDPALVAAALTAEINSTNWISANAPHALLASNTGAQIAVTAGRYGSVNVNGTSVASVSGACFAGITPGAPILLAGAGYTVASVQSPTALTLTSSAPAASSVMYVAPRGGYDGNMIRLYTLSMTSTLTFDQSRIALSGGSSAVTWQCSIDFTASGIDQLRQCWLTFAPALANASAFTTTEWEAVFSNWQVADPDSVQALQVAGPGSVRIEDDDTNCRYGGAWTVEAGFYSKYFAHATSDPTASLTVAYNCQFTHNLYVGTSLYTDRAVAGVTVDGDAVTQLNCVLNTDPAVVTRRLLRTAVAPGAHTVTFSLLAAGVFYFDFLEAAVLSDVPDALSPRTGVSPALDFDTDQTYKMSPARLMWLLNKLGYAGPMNEYLGVFWWNERVISGGSLSTAQIGFSGNFAGGDAVFITLNGSVIGKTVFPADTLETIAIHFADYINGSFVAAWASANEATLTITGRSPAPAYNLTISVSATSANGQVALTGTPQAGVYGTWVVDDTANPPLNRATRDWHTDFYSLVAASGLEVVTACSMELVNPPAGYAALYPDSTEVTTATGFGSLFSTQCAVGSSKMVAYQNAAYLAIAQLQSAAGLTPSIQFGEFLWWYFADSSGMAYYDAETMAAAQAALGRPLPVFLTPNDDPGVNGGADATFLRNRLRDHVAALASALRNAYPQVRCEVLWPYDVNYPTALPSGLGGQLNYFVNLPVEWKTPSASGLDGIKAEALEFGATLRNLDLAKQAIALFPAFGWPASSVRYLVPVSGSAVPWARELALVWAEGLPVANLWALDHICLYNLTVPEPGLERRSFTV